MKTYSSETKINPWTGGRAMDWNQVAVFLDVARTGSFTASAAGLPGAGARRVRTMSAVSVARHVRALELQVGAALVVSSTKGVSLTARGEALRHELEPLEKAMRAATRTIGSLGSLGRRQTVRVSGTEPVIAELLAPHASAFSIANRGIELQLVASNKVVSLAGFEAEIALRFARPQGDGLLVRKVSEIGLSLYRHRDLKDDWRLARVSGFDDSFGDIAEVRWLREQGLEKRLILKTSSTRALLQMVLAGECIALLPDRLAMGDDRLVACDDAPRPPARVLWMMAHRDMARIPEVRSAMEWIAGVV
jgi:DNA-binding transcriptional LysR family regulator